MLRERWQNASPAERQKMIARVRARRVHPAPHGGPPARP
jgi:predicted Fe-S protein YdhL (DUF1289 family)